MPTTVSIKDETHLLILKKQRELLDKDKRIKISEIVDQCIRNYVDKIN